MKRGRLMVVTWRDSVTLGRGGWKNAGEVATLEPALIETVGWVLRETSLSLTLAASWDDDSEPHVEGHMCIPKGCIVKKRLVR